MFNRAPRPLKPARDTGMLENLVINQRLTERTVTGQMRFVMRTSVYVRPWKSWRIFVRRPSSRRHRFIHCPHRSKTVTKKSFALRHSLRKAQIWKSSLTAMPWLMPKTASATWTRKWTIWIQKTQVLETSSTMPTLSWIGATIWSSKIESYRWRFRIYVRTMLDLRVTLSILRMLLSD